MTAYEVKSFMKQHWRLKKEINAKYSSLIELRSMAEKTTSTLTGMPSSHSEGSKVENYAIRLVEMQIDMEECVNQLIEIRQKTVRMIDLASDPLARAILTEYHINGKTLEVTAETIGYSTRQIINIMNKSYEEIAEKISLNFIESL